MTFHLFFRTLFAFLGVNFLSKFDKFKFVLFVASAVLSGWTASDPASAAFIVMSLVVRIVSKPFLSLLIVISARFWRRLLVRPLPFQMEGLEWLAAAGLCRRPDIVWSLLCWEESGV